MKLKLKLERKVDVYEEDSNVTFKGLSKENQRIIGRIEDMNEKLNRNIVKINKHSIDELICIGINKFKKEQATEIKPSFLWKRLWVYFDLLKYKDECFSPKKKKSFTKDEMAFLSKYFKDPSCTDTKIKKLDEDARKRIDWAATNLYQMIDRRIPITDDIREKFYNVTKDRIVIGNNEFENIAISIEELRKKVFEEKEEEEEKGEEKDVKSCLSIKEKDVWSVSFAKEIKEVVDKWERIYIIMNEIKNEDKEKNKNEAIYEYTYSGVVQPEILLKDAIKKEKEVYEESCQK